MKEGNEIQKSIGDSETEKEILQKTVGDSETEKEILQKTVGDSETEKEILQKVTMAIKSVCKKIFSYIVRFFS